MVPYQNHMSVSLSVKNVPDDVARRLRARAKRNRRSLQGELLAILESAVARPLTIDELRKRARSIGVRTSDDSTEIIRQWRDTRYGES